MRYRPYIIGILIALLVEVTVFNFSALRSLGYSPVDLTSGAVIEENSDGSVIYHITDIGVKINNLRFDFENANSQTSDAGLNVDYGISLSDEGNLYTYDLPQGSISWISPESFYTNVYSYGAVRTMDISFDPLDGRSVTITANVKRPVIFNGIRFLLVTICIFFFAALREKGNLAGITMDEKWTLAWRSMKEKCSLPQRNKEEKCPLTRKTSKIRSKSFWQPLVTAFVVILWIGLAFFWSGSKVDFNEATKPHHQQYKELACSLERGSVEIPVTPSKELVEAQNPYDTIYLQANGIDYLADYAYFEGKYYVYFGIVPELMLYLPYHLITGGDLANHYAVFAYYALFVVGVFLLFRQIALKYFKDIRFFAYLIISSLVVTAGTFAYIFFTADIYSVPIMAGLGLTAAGLGLWLKAVRLLKNMKRALGWSLLFLGSLCMALVAGCRPQLLVFSLLAIPFLFVGNLQSADGSGLKGSNITGSQKVVTLLCLLLPYALAAAPVMWYNYARFGSVVDFGATYSLTNNDMNLRGVSIARMLLGLGTFLFQIPCVNGVFPFIHSVDLKFSYMGKLVTEHFLGGIITINVFTWVLALYGRYHWCIKAKKLRLFMAVSLACALLIGLVDANTAGMLQRYSADLAFGIFLAAGVLLMILVEQAPKTGMKFLKISFWTGLLVSLLIICNTASGITLELYNKDLFVLIGNIFRF